MERYLNDISLLMASYRLTWTPVEVDQADSPSTGESVRFSPKITAISVPALATSGDAGPGIVGNDGDGYQG